NRDEINIEKWDDCIKNSLNSRVYAYSWYLDITSEKKWKAIIVNDYEFVLPFAVKRKYMINYVYQPFFTQQLGVFSKNEIKEDVIKKLLSIFKEKYRFVNLNINSSNKLSNFNISEKVNYELNLNNSYENLRQSFSKNTETYLKKALKNNLGVSNNATIKELINLKRNKPTINLSPDKLDLLEKLLNVCEQKEMLKIYSAKNKNGDLISAFAFVFSSNRAYYIFSESNEEGRKNNAAFFLMNKFIEDHADSKLILDFEGSMIPGVARFFKGWGAKNNPYYNFQVNRLPLFLRIFKK
ncbi:MAG: hypothetical protein GXO49_04925, partial [Chlorobi bacterium]|nr:hypothetical protein [Chlorobiota bacterium]